MVLLILNQLIDMNPVIKTSPYLIKQLCVNISQTINYQTFAPKGFWNPYLSLQVFDIAKTKGAIPINSVLHVTNFLGEKYCFILNDQLSLTTTDNICNAIRFEDNEHVVDTRRAGIINSSTQDNLSPPRKSRVIWRDLSKNQLIFIESHYPHNSFVTIKNPLCDDKYDLILNKEERYPCHMVVNGEVYTSISSMSKKSLEGVPCLNKYGVHNNLLQLIPRNYLSKGFSMTVIPNPTHIMSNDFNPKANIAFIKNTKYFAVKPYNYTW